MAQPERVADFVHRHALDVLAHELLRDRPGGVEILACGQHVERIGHLVGQVIGVAAGTRVGAVGVRMVTVRGRRQDPGAQ